ncbi:hypothetical protein ACE939_08770 [Aquimarina sp. W85]|uniref:hypothetical protein n=1 Tax=Aquimarina rhodophyticola TaxID=3342246 RepID=UPI0036728750
MKIFFSILLVATFAIQPLLEMGNILYYQLNLDYIVEKFCVNKERPSLNCNGKCYLMSQMKTQSLSEDAPIKTTISVETFIPLFFENISIELTGDNQIKSVTYQNWEYRSPYYQQYNSKIDHPPEVFFS